MKKITEFTHSREFSCKIHDLIPGGAHTYSKGDDQFPLNSPAAISHGSGARVWDLDGNEYVDWGMGLASVSIGHGYEPVARAVGEAASKGTNFMRPAAIELEAAQVFLDTVRSGDMVKFAKNGSTITTAAVKLARAHTGRAKVAIAREHPFFSYDDWFISSTDSDFGIPEAIREFTLRFGYNDLESLEKLFREHRDEIACVILEPVKFDTPREGFLQGVGELCRENGAVFVLDEMICGFKWGMAGAQDYFGVKPDLSTWGKGIANGFSACALTGRAEIMELGGIRRSGQRKLFLISTTHGAETTGLAALLETIRSFQQHDMIARNWATGEALKKRLQNVIERHGLQKALVVNGYPCYFALECRNQNSQLDDAFRTLMMQEMIARGVLFQGLFFMTWSHGPKELDQTVAAFEEACETYARAINAGGTGGLLSGPPAKPVFRRSI
jgi:glutamate-1-semialdehyde 2,1-aminomutase